MSAPFRYRITSGMMPSYVNKPVIMVVKFISGDGINLKVECTDGPIIMVQMSQPINGYLEPGTYLELEGTPHGRNSLKVESCTQIPNALAESFDHELYNEIVKAQATRFDENKIRIHDVHEHFGGSSAEDLQLLTKPSAQQGFGDQSFM